MKKSNEKRVYGLGVSPGICIGKAYLVDTQGVDVIKKYNISADKPELEIKRFKNAVTSARDEVRSIIKKSRKKFGNNVIILETHEILLKDKLLYDKTIETIKNEHINAEWALKQVVANIISMFQTITDPYLKARTSDINQVTHRVMKNLVGAAHVDISAIDKRVILVAQELSPADASRINLESIKGFITDKGGKASHTAIIVRTLEIPAIMGLKKITSIINNDDLIIVDGSSGTVIINPSKNTLISFKEKQHEYEREKAEIDRKSHLPAKTRDGHFVSIMGNIELPEEIFSVINYGGDGIGLYRTEFQYLGQSDLPSEDELFERYKDVVEVMSPKPVTIRTLDINGDKALLTDIYHKEENPALGMRAIRYCLKNPDIFKTQLRAILRATVYGNVRILIPMISTYDEIIETKKIIEKAADSLQEKGINIHENIEIGIMIEVPSAVIIADKLAEVVDFFSIGTNDLTQYTLAVDRENRKVAHLFNTLNPAIIRMIKHVTDMAKEKNIKVFMCGEMAADPLSIPILLGLRIDELSMNPRSIPGVKNMIRSMNAQSASDFINMVLEKKTTQEITELVQKTYGSIL